jgi:hypothetical protein
MIVGLLVLSGLGAAALTLDKETSDGNTPSAPLAYTHTVLAEEASGTWCQYCPPVMQQMDQLYDSGSYDFYFVSLVEDKNPYAHARCVSEYNIYGYPTVYYDGGYRVVVGAGTLQAQINALNAAGARVTPDVDLSLNIQWLGNAKIGVTLNVTNNQANGYGGHIHAYVTEMNSRWWNNISGHTRYRYAMIGNYALNQNIQVQPGQTGSYYSMWNGSLYGMGNIVSSNIMVIAAVFNSTVHQGYSYPPSQNPFNAYYADDTTAATFPTSSLLIDGHCFYPGQVPANTVTVSITNVNSGATWQANTNNNYYSKLLAPGQDVSAGDTLRIIARDTNESVNVTDHVVTSNDISTGAVHTDVTLRVHYRDLNNFPFYISTVDTGAAVMKMMMDYLMWNSTQYPSGPQSVYNEQTLYNLYHGSDNSVNADEMSAGLNSQIDDLGHGWVYGYFFTPYANANANEVLKQICVWLDYPVNYYNNNRDVPVPKQGYPNHVPVAVPTDGDYESWMTIRGIHTDRNAWLPPGQLTVYGFWLNDPASGGLGSNTYVTTSRFLSTYYEPLNVPGDTYNGQYVALVDPYQIHDVDAAKNVQLTIGTLHPPLTVKEQSMIQAAQHNIAPLLTKDMANKAIIKAAFDQTMNVLKYDRTDLAASFAKATVVGKPLWKNAAWTVQFSSGPTLFTIHLDGTATLLEFSIQ